MVMHPTLFTRFAEIKRFSFVSQSLSGSKMNWNLEAFGTTAVQIGENQIDFLDEFSAQNRQFSDRKRWIFTEKALIFQHYRAERYLTVFEFQDFNETAQHHCLPDVYSGQLQALPEALILTIHIQGERKNERLIYRYFS